MKKIARNTLRCFVAAFVVIASAARAETTEELANRSNCIVGFELTGPAAISYHTTVAVGGTAHAEQQSFDPYGNTSGGASRAPFGMSLTISTALVKDTQAPRVAVTLEYEVAIKVGESANGQPPPAKAFKIRATAKLPFAGGDITLEQKDIEVLRREGLDATPFKLRLLMKLAPVSKG